jgi:hypothetical protein
MPISICTWKESGNSMRTVVVANVVVQVDLGVVPLAVGPLEASSEHVSVIDANVIGRVVKRHVGNVPK